MAPTAEANVTRTRRSAAALATVTVVALWSAPAAADFPADPPDDPVYDRAEENPVLYSPLDEQYYLYDFLPRGAPLASDPEGSSGMWVNRAWSDFTIGRPDVVIAYVEAGINWHDDTIRELADKVYVNPGELPPRERDNGDPWFNAADYPSTRDANGNGIVDAEDLIVAFSDGVDDDGNGYVDDISGWDTYHDQNDPATPDTAYSHANSQMEQAAAITDNGFDEAGICPLCMVLPVKAGAEALDRTDDLAEAWLFAADAGADVIVSVTADLGYSSFMHQAVEDIAHRGVVMAEASNDFNSTDHQGGMWWPHVLPGNGMVADTVGTEAGGHATTTYRVRSGFTSWGTHNDLTVATQGGTTSEATPTVGGVAAMTLAYGRDAAEQGLIDRPLDGFEVVQVLRATASDVADPTLPWPNQPGFDLQYGYGRPNVWRAMDAISRGDVPPVATIESPAWFRLYDPTTTSSFEVEAHVGAPRSPSYDWAIEFAVGPQPTEQEFTVIASGSAETPREVAATVDLSRVPEAVWAAAYELSETKTLESSERYTVTVRVQVTDADGRVGQDRRTVAVHHDESWMPGFPVHLGVHGGESQPAVVDLAGLGHLQIVYGDTDGLIHALDPATGEELAGWPVATDPVEVARDNPDIDEGHEPVVASVSVGDLAHTGELQVVATTLSGKVYVFEADGRRRPGWPKRLDTGVEPLPIPRPQITLARNPVVGALAPATLFDLDGNATLEVIQAAWDGHLHVWNAAGEPLPGWPLKVELPQDHRPSFGRTVVNDEKLSAAPAIADLDGDGDPEIVVKSQYGETYGAGLQPFGGGHVHAYHHDATPVAGWPVEMQSFVIYYGSAQEFITEGIGMPVSADVDGDGADEVAVGPVLSPTYLIDGSGDITGVYGPLPGFDPTAAPSPTADELGDLLDGLAVDAPISFTTSGAFGEFAGTLTYSQPGSGGLSTATSLLAAGSGSPITNFERVWDARTQVSIPGFPAELQGLDFLGSPIVVDVDGDGAAEVVNGGDTSALHAYTPGGGQADGFPKFHTGWDILAPSAGDLDGDGDVEIVQATREGYLFAWDTPGQATANDEWWHYRHDEWQTGRYGVDARPPGVIRDGRLAGATVRFVAPGDDWYVGTPAAYLVDGREVEAAAAAGERVTVEVPSDAAQVTIQGVDDAGNLGRPVTVEAGDTAAPTPRRTLPATGGASAAAALVLLALAAVARRRTARALRSR